MSFGLVLGGLGALAGGATNGFKDWDPSSWATNLGTNIKNTWDYMKNGNTNSMNYDIAMKNLEMQQNENDYQHALQERIFDREDTAYQRTVEDMRQAGLNPLAMNGTDNAGEAIATQAPQINYQHQDKSPIDMLAEVYSIANAVQDFNIGFAYNEEQIAKAEQAKANATVAKNEAIKSTKNLDSELNRDSMRIEDEIRNYEWNKNTDTFNGMREQDRNARYKDLINTEGTNNRLKTTLSKSYEDYINSNNELKKWIGGEASGKVYKTMNNIMDKVTDSVNEEVEGYKNDNEEGKKKRRGKYRTYARMGMKMLLGW